MPHCSQYSSPRSSWADVPQVRQSAGSNRYTAAKSARCANTSPQLPRFVFVTALTRHRLSEPSVPPMYVATTLTFLTSGQPQRNVRPSDVVPTFGFDPERAGEVPTLGFDFESDRTGAEMKNAGAAPRRAAPAATYLGCEQKLRYVTPS